MLGLAGYVLPTQSLVADLEGALDRNLWGSASTSPPRCSSASAGVVRLRGRSRVTRVHAPG
ncbi:hypothetical protein PHK61_08235 [Actinomycetospora lutea]|uniref:hypothetical protein n=1 Tax=Actinomycetospora lutea TaxID=663604 RepID=UPI002366C050|nr:hypothetical protein [Actinomycetospora lutea]MDD7938406.1 hypothetical protein [Actinomycetospora lutea]